MFYCVDDWKAFFIRRLSKCVNSVKSNITVVRHKIMKYAFIDSMGSLTYNNGVKMQAFMWKEGLEGIGEEVTLVNLWEDIDFSRFDAVVIFAMGANIYKLVSNLSRINKNIVLAPIIDPDRSDKVYRFLFRRYGSTRLALSNHFHDLWTVRDKVRLWLVRSEQERHYVNYCLGIPHGRIAKVPLNYRVPDAGVIGRKEDFCLHVSRLDAPNKNVRRLVDAAKRYGFRLKLAGHVFGEKEKAELHDMISGYGNIEYLGEVSEGRLLELYRSAKVFALPSLREGVGMAALEAAAYGCEIVLTDVGAPKEYYEGRAILVNPKSVDDIGRGVMKALKEGYSQPELSEFVQHNYNSKCCSVILNESIMNAVRMKC